MTDAILDTALFLLERFGEAVDREYLTAVVRLEIETLTDKLKTAPNDD